MGDRAQHAERTVLRPPVALRAGAFLLTAFPLVFTVLLGRDGEGGYWTQATAVLCMAVVLAAGLAGLSVQLVLTPTEIRVINWTEEWRLPVAAILGVGADDGLYFSTARGRVRSACAQPSVLGGLTGYRRAQELRARCERVLGAVGGEGVVTRRWRWSRLSVLALAAVGLWVLYSAAFLLR